MANIKSAKKRIKTNDKARMRNKTLRTSLRTAVKNVNAAIEAGDKKEAEVLLVEAVKRLDSSVSKGIIHKNKASRDKSRLTKKVNAM